MVASIGEVLDHADVIVIGNRGAEFTGARRPTARQISSWSTSSASRQIEERHGNYSGICW